MAFWSEWTKNKQTSAKSWFPIEGEWVMKIQKH
jgi:poly(3-hydroxyalkanoate) synthetase